MMTADVVRLPSLDLESRQPIERADGDRIHTTEHARGVVVDAPRPNVVRRKEPINQQREPREALDRRRAFDDEMKARAQPQRENARPRVPQTECQK
jgi:hypothetical protein